MAEDYKNRVGEHGKGNLPPLDIFGDKRGPGYSLRGIGGGKVIAYPHGADMAEVEALIEKIQAALKSAPAAPTPAPKKDD